WPSEGLLDSSGVLAVTSCSPFGAGAEGGPCQPTAHDCNLSGGSPKGTSVTSGLCCFLRTIVVWTGSAPTGSPDPTRAGLLARRTAPSAEAAEELPDVGQQQVRLLH